MLHLYITPLLALTPFTIVSYVLFWTMKLSSSFLFPIWSFSIRNFSFCLLSLLNAYTALINVLAADAMLYSMITIILVEFDILKVDLIINSLKISKEARANKMQELIDHHNVLLDLSDRLEEDFYSGRFILSFVISALIMWFVVFRISQSNELATIPFFSYFYMMGGSILLLCIYVQKLIDSSASMADEIFESESKSVDDKLLGRQMILIISRAQKFKQLAAMSFTKIFLETLTTVS